MPFTGSVDITDIVANLGDKSHGLRPALGPAENTEEQEDDTPHRATYGPVDFTTSMAMQKSWKMIWDVNGYYRDLGIFWPFTPTKKELRIAYRDSDGPNSEYLTYVFKQLLDPKTREAYDNMPLGKRYRDKYVLAEQSRSLAALAAERSLNEGKVVSMSDLLEGESEWVADQQRQEEYVNNLRNRGNSNTWLWGYYLMNSRKNEYEDLIIWQEMLIKALNAKGVARVICIGYIGKCKTDFVVRVWNNKTIIFLNEEVEPTPELAEAVASYFAPRKALK